MSKSMRDPPRRARGQQPYFFDNPAIDQLHAAVITLASELSVAFDRIDTLERLLQRDGTFSRSDIDTFAPDAAAQAERAARRTDIAARVLRPFVQYREVLLQHSASASPRQETES
jgi:hypothetical protein